MDPLLLRAIRNEPIERPPVWMMRQAGRYLLEYQEVKAKHTFLEMCTTPELALEVTMQPMRIFDPDAAIVFADILLPLQALGMSVDFTPGPAVAAPLKNRSDIEALRYKDPASTLGYVLETIRGLKRELGASFPAPNGKAVLGFAGAPWTMACYMLDQGPFKHFQGTQVFAYQDSGAMDQLLKTVGELTGDYLEAQFQSGADAVQLFDTWAGNLSEEDYRRFALPPTIDILARMRKLGCPTILYVNGSSHLLRAMAEAGATCISVDWRTPLKAAQTAVGAGRVVQGNFDPTHLFGSREEVVKRTTAMLSSVERRSGYIANLGHGILQRTPRENVKAFIETIKKGWPNR